MYWEKRNTFHFWKKIYGNVGIVRFYVFLNFQIQVSLEKVLYLPLGLGIRSGLAEAESYSVSVIMALLSTLYPTEYVAVWLSVPEVRLFILPVETKRFLTKQ